MSLEAAQEQLQNALTTTFLANLVFLSEYDNELYQKVDALSRLIEMGEYQERYVLEFLKEEGEFDIYDLENKVYLYGKNPKKINNTLVKRVELDDKNTIKTIEKAALKEYSGILEKFFLKENISDYAGQYLLQDLNFYNKIFKEKTIEIKIKYKKFEKFVFFGTLLGRHIPRIAEKMNSYAYMVFEQNLEIFRLSLFTVDYTILAKRGGVVFSIMEDDYDAKIETFLNHDNTNNNVIKFSSTYNNTKKYIDDFLYKIIAKRNVTFDYNRMVYNVIKNTSSQWRKDYLKLILNDIKEEFTYLKTKPILYIAAGPSMRDNLTWIKENQKKFIIVTVGAVYKTLIENDIKIDILFTVDGSYKVLYEKQFSSENVALLSDEIIIASMLTHNKILDSFNKNNVFLNETMFCFHPNSYDIPVYSVGEWGLGILLKMNAKKIYLVGLDMALNQDTGDTHAYSKTSASLKHDLKDEKQVIGNTQYLGLNSGLIKVKGNIKEEVFTTGLFKNSISIIDFLLKNLRKDVNIYNLSNHGAYFKNTFPLKTEDVNINSFEDIQFNKKEFKYILKELSTRSLENESKIKIKEELIFLEEILTNDYKVFLEDKSINFDEFIRKNISFFSKLTSNDTNYSVIVFKNYFDITLNHLSFYFNRRKLKDEDKKLKLVKKAMQDKIKELIEDMIFYFKESI